MMSIRALKCPHCSFFRRPSGARGSLSHAYRWLSPPANFPHPAGMNQRERIFLRKSPDVGVLRPRHALGDDPLIEFLACQETRSHRGSAQIQTLFVSFLGDGGGFVITDVLSAGAAGKITKRRRRE